MIEVKDDINKTVELIINNKINSIDDILKIKKEMAFLNEVIKELSKRNYEIISIKPLRVEKK